MIERLRPLINTRKQSTNFGETRYCEVYNAKFIHVHYMQLQWQLTFLRKEKSHSPSNYIS